MGSDIDEESIIDEEDVHYELVPINTKYRLCFCTFYNLITYIPVICCGTICTITIILVIIQLQQLQNQLKIKPYVNSTINIQNNTDDLYLITCC